MTVEGGGAPGFDLDLRVPLAAFELRFRLATDVRALGIFGPSGAGKTSVLEAIAGWRRDVRGHARLGDRTWFDDARGIDVAVEDRGVGYVPQEGLLFPHRDVRANLAFGDRRASAAGGRGASAIDRERVVAVLGLEGLLDRSIATLSGGERQRVSLARALCSQPEVLLLDEPLASLDQALRRRILPYLIRVREEFRVPTVFVSHDAAEVQALCDEVAVLEGGEIVAHGKPADVLRATLPPGLAHTNVLRGTVRAVGLGSARVEVAPGVLVHVPAAGLAVGERAVLAIGAEEVLVARGELGRISARNRLRGRIVVLAHEGGDVRADVELGAGAVLSSLLTSGAADELELDVGAEVELVFKTQSCRVLSR